MSKSLQSLLIVLIILALIIGFGFGQMSAVDSKYLSNQHALCAIWGNYVVDENEILSTASGLVFVIDSSTSISDLSNVTWEVTIKNKTIVLKLSEAKIVKCDL